MVSIRNIPVKLVDTAGIRKTEDIIEKIGIEKSKDSFNKADLVIFVLDGSRDLEEEDEEILSVLMDKEAIVVINKSDLKQQISVEDLKKRLPKAKFIISSMKEGIGISEIEDDIEQRVFSGQVKQASSVMVTNVRHKHLLEQAESSVSDGLSMTKIHEPLEFIEIDINRCYEILGEIIGETASDDIINEVFARFCLGK
jgi:tRNA modification GTPase